MGKRTKILDRTRRIESGSISIIFLDKILLSHERKIPNFGEIDNTTTTVERNITVDTESLKRIKSKLGMTKRPSRRLKIRRNRSTLFL